MDFRNQNGQRKYNTVEDEGHHVGYDLPHKEETINNIHFLPELHFLQRNRQTINY